MRNRYYVKRIKYFVLQVTHFGSKGTPYTYTHWPSLALNMCKCSAPRKTCFLPNYCTADQKRHDPT